MVAAPRAALRPAAQYPRTARLYLDARRKFAGVFIDVEHVALRILPHSHFAQSSDRVRAYCSYGPIVEISASSILENEDERRVIGVLRHELGHAVEACYGAATVKEFLGLRRSLKAEALADAIAGAVFGVAIRYDADAIQTTGVGSHRPDWLPS